MSNRFRLVRAAAILFVLGCVAAQWRPSTGFTSLLRFGHDLDERRLPVVAALPLAIVPGAGYDGQYYAQLAVEPDVHRPDVQQALDSTAYRGRRILLPLVAHALGFGSPSAILTVFALLNVVAWLALAWCWWRWLPDHGPLGTAAWAASLLSLGALDSVRFSLTDLPMTLGLLLAVRLAETGRPQLAALLQLAAGFIRETAVLAALPLRLPTDRRAWLRAVLTTATVVLPVAAWCLWLAHIAPDASAGIRGNLDWPGFAFVRHLGTCGAALAHGNFDSRYLFGLLGALGLAYQSVFVLARWQSDDPWLRLGLPFAVLFWFLGDYVWHGYWAVARSVLPLTFAFNRAILAERRPAWALAAGNLSVLHSLYRFLPF